MSVICSFVLVFFKSKFNNALTEKIIFFLELILFIIKIQGHLLLNSNHSDLII